MSDEVIIQGALGRQIQLRTGTPQRVTVARVAEVKWVSIADQPAIHCARLGATVGKPIVALDYTQNGIAFLSIAPVPTERRPLRIKRIELAQYNESGSVIRNSSIVHGSVVGDPLSVTFDMTDLLLALDTAVNRNLVEAAITLDVGGTEVTARSTNLLHLVKQDIIVFLPGVAGSEIEVASHPGEFSFAAWSVSFAPGSDEFRRLSCASSGNPNPNTQATRVVLFEKFEILGPPVPGEATPTIEVYDVIDRDELLKAEDHPVLELLQGGRRTGTVLQYYKVVPWPYDWRLRLEFAVDWLLGDTPHGPNVGASLPSITQLLAEHKVSMPFLRERAVVAGHSTGGVVMRGLLSDPRAVDLVEHAFFINVPFFGAPKAYFVYLTGEILPFISEPLMQEMSPNFPIVYYLAPTERYADAVASLDGSAVRRSAGQNVGNAVVNPLIAKMKSNYPNAFPRWNDGLEKRAREYHGAVTTPVIGWEQCTVFWSLTTVPTTPGPVSIKDEDAEHELIAGDGTVPETSLKGDSPAARQVRLPGDVEHVPAPNQPTVWKRIADELSSIL